jgi:hypothetical protein
MTIEQAETPGVSLDDIAELLRLVRASQFDEVEIEWGDIKMRVRHVPLARAQGADHQSRSSRSKLSP